jgi:hypothetical protein
MSVFTAFGAGAAVAVLAVGSVAAASAASAETTPAAGTTISACDRLSQRIERVGQAQTRLHADANTKGSLAYLQAKIDAATKAGHADQAAAQTHRLEIRKDIDGILPDVLTNLNDAKTVCASLPDVKVGVRKGDSDGGRCDHLGDRIKRVDAMRARFTSADAKTPGSMNYLTAKIAEAKAAGKTDLARGLQDRLNVRNKINGILPDVQHHLNDLQQLCLAHPAASKSGATATPNPTDS